MPPTDALNDPDLLAAYVGSPVALLSTDGEVVLELDVDRISDPRQDGPWQFFSVVLTGPPEPLLPQDSYLLRFPDGRRDHWLLVANAADATSVTYSASFSRETA